MSRNRRFWGWLLLAGLSVVPAAGFALDAGKYQNNVDTTTLSLLLHGPNALGFFTKHMPALVRTDAPLSPATVSSASANGLMFVQYRSPRGPVDLELHARIANGTLETDYTPEQIDAIVYEWEETYATPAPLKNLRPRMKHLTFRDGEGLVYDLSLKRRFDYALTMSIPYDAAQKKLQNVLPEMDEARKFIGEIEGEERGRVILANNKSGLPPFIVFEEKDGARVIHLHHPMHDIFFNRSARTLDFFYSDELASVSMLPEVKKLLEDPAVHKFVFEKPETVRVSVQGNKKNGFNCVFSRMTSGDRLAVRLEGRKITLL